MTTTARADASAPPRIGERVTCRFRDLARSTHEITGTLTSIGATYIALDVGGERRVISKQALRRIECAPGTTTGQEQEQ